MNSSLSTSPLLSQILPAAGCSSVLIVKTVCAFAFIVFHNKHCMYLMNVLARMLTKTLDRMGTSFSPRRPHQSLWRWGYFKHTGSFSVLPAPCQEQHCHSQSLIDERCYMILMHWHRRKYWNPWFKTVFQKVWAPSLPTFESPDFCHQYPQSHLWFLAYIIPCIIWYSYKAYDKYLPNGQIH